MLIQIIAPIVVLTSIVLGLSALVLLARHRLAPTHAVKIDVNGKRSLDANAGRRLLTTLADNGIYLPAACGGRGTCGQCKVTVESGGGPALPTESVHVSPEEAEGGVRLACLLKVRDDMRIHVPESVLDVQRWSCEVISNRSIATYLKELVVKLPNQTLIDFTAGAYVLLETPPYRFSFQDFDIDPRYRDEWHRYNIDEFKSVVRAPAVRAYSLANPPQQADRIVLVVRIALPPASAPPGAPPGQVSSYIFGLKPRDRVSISGPFGEFGAHDSANEMVFIAGGAGIAPLRSIILDQLARGTGRKMSLWYGARDVNDLCYADEFTDLAEKNGNFDFYVALSAPRDTDEWKGHTGFIHRTVYDHYLEDHPAPQDVEYYLCGPPVMSAAVVEMLSQLGVKPDKIFFDDFGG